MGVDGVGFLIPFRVEVSLSSAHLVRFDQADINRLGDQDTSYYIMLHLQEKKAGSLKRSRSLLDLYRGVYVIICVIICCIIICYIICFFHFFSMPGFARCAVSKACTTLLCYTRTLTSAAQGDATEQEAVVAV